MPFKNLFQSKSFRIAVIVIGALALLLSVFEVGVRVGYGKANFSYRWGEQYHRNFGGPPEGFFREGRFGAGMDKMMPPPPSDFVGAHGTFGRVIRASDGKAGEPVTLIVVGKDSVERTIVIAADTVIRRSMQEALLPSEIKVDDQIVVIGDPNDQGQVVAKFIRLFPAIVR